LELDRTRIPDKGCRFDHSSQQPLNPYKRKWSAPKRIIDLRLDENLRPRAKEGKGFASALRDGYEHLRVKRFVEISTHGFCSKTKIASRVVWFDRLARDNKSRDCFGRYFL
jgi:hypothetical protein